MNNLKPSTYIVNNRPHKPSDEDFQSVLAGAHLYGKPVQCVCRINQDGEGQSCYVAKLRSNDGVKYVVKRLPGTGDKHRITCEHYEINEMLSGRAGLSKDAIVEDTNSGVFTIKLQVPLNKKLSAPSSRGAITAPIRTKDTSVSVKQSNLTMLGLLHYLLGSTGLNRWSPKMEGKRHYGLVQYLLSKQVNKTYAKKERLSGRFFMPPAFNKEKVEENRNNYFKFIMSLKPKLGKAPVGVFVGKFKAFGDAINFSTIQVTHLGNKHHLIIEEEAIAKILKKHQSAFEMQSVYPELQLFFIATVTNFHDLLRIETIDFMLLSPEFLPLEPFDHDWRLHRQLIDERRYFEKPMRFSMPVNKPLSSAVLLDTPDTSIALMFDCNLPKKERKFEPEGINQGVGDQQQLLTSNTDNTMSLSSTNDNFDDDEPGQEIILPDDMVIIQHDDYKWNLPN